MSDHPSLDDIAELGRRIEQRVRAHGCTCDPVVIRLAQTDGYWFADVSHDKACPFDEPDEFIDGFT